MLKKMHHGSEKNIFAILFRVWLSLPPPHHHGHHSSDHQYLVIRVRPQQREHRRETVLCRVLLAVRTGRHISSEIGQAGDARGGEQNGFEHGLVCARDTGQLLVRVCEGMKRGEKERRSETVEKWEKERERLR